MKNSSLHWKYNHAEFPCIYMRGKKLVLKFSWLSNNNQTIKNLIKKTSIHHQILARILCPQTSLESCNVRYWLSNVPYKLSHVIFSQFVLKIKVSLISDALFNGKKRTVDVAKGSSSFVQFCLCLGLQGCSSLHKENKFIFSFLRIKCNTLYISLSLNNEVNIHEIWWKLDNLLSKPNFSLPLN